MSHSKTRSGWQRAGLALIASVVLVLTACSSLPDDLQGRSDALDKQISAVEEAIKKNTEVFDAKLKEKKYAFIGEYSKEQQHRDRFGQASAKIEEAKQARDEKLKPLFGDFEESKRAEVDAAFAEVEAIVAEANTLAADPLEWLDYVVATKEQPSPRVENARKASNGIVADLAALEGEALATGQSFPTAATEINKRVAPLADARDSALAALSRADTELAKPKPNFAVLATDLMEIDRLSAGYVDGAATLRTGFAGLPTSETHTLLDLRVDSFVEVSRTAWDENLDWPDEHDYDYPTVLAKTETATYFAGLVGQKIGDINSNWSNLEFSLVSGVDAEHWKALKIDNPMADWPNGDNMGEVYVDAIDDTYCQKIKVLRNGEPDSSGRPDPAANYCSQYDTPSEIKDGIYWVDADEFNADAIGMDVYSKAYGDFVDQASTTATPPGMAYVGDPATGEWREDSNGNSFWYYYGQYAFFSQLIGGPNSYHYRSEYDTWNRSHRYTNQPFYAGTTNTPRYGANSPQVSSRFPNSAFVSSGLSNPTVRNAGPAARAGGPGNGGK